MLFPEITRVLDPLPHSAALNMAIDEVLTGSITRPTLRVYEWSEPAVSFGYFGRIQEVREHWPGRPLVRRWTGGGEVPHGEDFTYTLVVPQSDPFCQQHLRDSYRLIHEVLQSLIPGSHLAETCGAAAAACFAGPVHADLLCDGRKIAGALDEN